MRPVLDSNSIISEEINSIGDFIFKNAGEEDKRESSINENEKVFNDKIIGRYLSLISSIKNYQGDLVRKEKTYKNYKFYDEREWRYIPREIMDKVIFNQKEYLTKRGSAENKPLLNDLPIRFKAIDIKYIITREDSEIPLLLNHIQSIDNLGKNHKEIEILGTKILVAKQIFEDF